jgi:glucose-6-phosphate 1-epimerase
MPAQNNRTAGRVIFVEGRGELPMLEIKTAWSTAAVYLHGAHVTHFQKKNEPPLLFLSQCSRFENGHPIRGGIPIIFPWFGKPADKPAQHGLVRNQPWLLKEIAPHTDGSVTVRFQFPKTSEVGFPPFLAEYAVTVNEHLTLELAVTNQSSTEIFEFENCLHTYFFVEDINAVSVHGLTGVTYIDRLAGNAVKIEGEEAIRIASEVDRTYLNTTSVVEIRDAKIGRTIRVEKENSASTVVWNPWIAKSQQIADFGNEEYHNMICVESGNVAGNKISLAPGQSSTLKVKLSSASDSFPQ